MDTECSLVNAIRQRNYAKFLQLTLLPQVHDLISTSKPNSPDEKGYSPIHYVAMVPLDDASKYFTSLLVYYWRTWNRKSQADVTQEVLGVRDPEGNTVLHLACKFKRFSLIADLLDKGANYRALNNNAWFPLHFAVDGKNLPKLHPEFQPMLRHLICQNEDSIPRDKWSVVNGAWDSVVQVAVAKCCLDTLEVLFEKGFSFKMPDHVVFDVACAGDIQVLPVAECLQFLSSHGCISYEETPFHLAARAARPGLLQAIVDLYANTGIIAQRTSQGFTALHLLAMHAKAIPSDVVTCAEILVHKRNHVSTQSWLDFLQMKDCNGKCALEICCHRRNVPLAKVILLATFVEEAGAHFWMEDDFLSLLYTTVPLAMLVIIEDSYERQLEPTEGNCRKVDYSVITGSQRNPKFTETAHLRRIVGHSRDIQTQMLLHPLVKDYLDNRWTKVARNRAYFSVAAQSLILLLYVTSTATCVCHYDTKHNTNSTDVEVNSEARNGWMCSANSCDATSILALVLIMAMLLKEVAQLACTYTLWIQYFASKYNWSQLIFIVVAIISTTMALLPAHYGQKGPLWLLGVIGILAAWVVAILQLRNLPLCGMYISILAQVTWKSIKILALFFPTFVAFSLVFPIVIRQGAFHSVGFWGVPVKLMAMMIGELTFDELIKDVQEVEAFTWRYYVVLLVFALFAFVATVVLLNLLVAMAVNITNEVESNAETEVARRTLEQIYMWETFDPFRKWCGARNASGTQISAGAPVPSQETELKPLGQLLASDDEDVAAV